MVSNAKVPKLRKGSCGTCYCIVPRLWLGRQQGKPFIFGGYILGILAYRTGHLWGGIIIHLGIALLFEALGLFYIM